MTYAVNFETTPRVIAVKLSTGGMMHASFGSVQYVNTGKQGIDGTTFYPSVEGDECTLSWTNDGNKENPKPVNLRGRQGPQGAPGSDADILPTTGNKKGDVWNIVNADAAHGVNAGDNVAWNGTTWDVLAGTMDLSAYMLAEDLVAISNTELDNICK